MGTSHMTISIPNTWLSVPAAGAPCTIIAEVAQAHDGSLGMAHAFIDAAARAGATAIKFQTHIAEAESTPAEPWRTRFSQQDDRRFDYWKRMEFSPAHWAGLKAHADDAKLLFLSSPFSPAAVALLRRTGVAAWKVASGELTNLPMITEMARDGIPMLLSTGMSAFDEIDTAVAIAREHRAPLAVFQCTTRYPSPPEAIGLNVLDDIRARYGCAAGLSDHSGTIFPALAAAAAHQAEVIEVHLTLSREMFGPDVVASVTTAELAQLCAGVRFIERMRAAPMNKSGLDPALQPMREIFFKSVVALSDLASGTVLAPEMLGVKKPGTGIRPARLESLIGMRLTRAVAADTPLRDEDLA